MAGYTSTPLWKKLGYKTGIEVRVEGAPPDYVALLQLPSDIEVQWLLQPRPGVSLVHVFCRQAATLKKRLAALRKLIASDGVIWVSWPKKASREQTDVTEDTVRACALPLGLVDIKVCAVNETWSGLKLMIRKTARR
jgi:hypothetical protein